MNPTLDGLPILILYPHNRCNCRCLMCGIWKTDTTRELTLADLTRHAEDFAALRLQWVVFSGGEPLMHSNLAPLCRFFRARGVRVTLLTTGLLLARHAAMVAEEIDEVIVSLDGPSSIHDRIRRVPGAYSALAAGVEALHRLRPALPISARCTVQRHNCRHLRLTAAAARSLGLASISFLAADTHSTAFDHTNGWDPATRAEVALTREDLAALESEIEALIAAWPGQSFVRESPAKLRAILAHFRADLGLAPPTAPRCNAPWVSAVLETNGALRPCFFHAPLGNITNSTILEVLNSPEAVRFRATLDIPTNPICRRCVCSLYRPTP
jgi:MoaA/NifB/PqqE/SkfB family radical SAM enzyme